MDQFLAHEPNWGGWVQAFEHAPAMAAPSGQLFLCEVSLFFLNFYNDNDTILSILNISS